MDASPLRWTSQNSGLLRPNAHLLRYRKYRRSVALGHRLYASADRQFGPCATTTAKRDKYKRPNFRAREKINALSRLE
jgi:hypothetical protein